MNRPITVISTGFVECSRRDRDLQLALPVYVFQAFRGIVLVLLMRVAGTAPIIHQPDTSQGFVQLRRCDGFGQYANGAQCARLAKVEVTAFGGIHHHRDGGGLRVILDGAHGFETVHAGHHVVHEDDVGAVAGEELQRTRSGFNGIDEDIVFFQHAAQYQSG